MVAGHLIWVAGASINSGFYEQNNNSGETFESFVFVWVFFLHSQTIGLT